MQLSQYELDIIIWMYSTYIEKGKELILFPLEDIKKLLKFYNTPYISYKRDQSDTSTSTSTSNSSCVVS